ncbi:MAG: hypothetical protein WD423_12845 [Rhodothermales bacterium]
MARRLNLVLMAVVVVAAFCATSTKAQVSVAPTALFLNDQERFGTLYIGNPTSTPQEVTIGFRFGYSTADSTGAVYVEFNDSTAAERYSIAENVRAFPQRFILPPGETQVVRMTARPPADFEEGWMWSRVVTTSTPQVSFQDTTASGVQANLIFRLQQVTALFYTKGDPEVTLNVVDVSARVDSNEVIVHAEMNKEGERPFFGRVNARLQNADGDVIAEEMNLIAVYVPERRRFVITLPEDVSEGQDLQVELTITPDRQDIPSEYVLDFSPIVATTPVTW